MCCNKVNLNLLKILTWKPHVTKEFDSLGVLGRKAQWSSNLTVQLSLAGLAS